MSADVRSILSSEDIFEHDRLLKAFTDHYPESTSWVIIKYAVNRFLAEENAWCFSNISAEYQWLKRKIDMESKVTLGKTFDLWIDPRMPRRADRPSWTVSECVLDKLAEEGYIKYNDEKTACYPTEKVFESIPVSEGPLIIEYFDKKQENTLAYERLKAYNKLNT